MTTSDGFPVVLVFAFFSFYVLVFITSTVGNVLVLTACYWSLKKTASSLKWFIANLATADLTFTVLSVFDLISFVWRWVGGQTTCKLQSFLIEASYTTSTMTLTIISFERLKAVLQPFSTRTSNPDRALKKVVTMWLISFISCSPLLYAYKSHAAGVDDAIVRCTNINFGEIGRQIYYGIHGVCFYLLPLMYMIYAQGKTFRALRLGVFPMQAAFSTASSRRHLRVAKTLSALTAAFLICWSPFVIIRALMYFHLTDGGYLWRGSQLLIFLNSALDPILYGLYGDNVRPILRKIIRFRRASRSTTVISLARNRTTLRSDEYNSSTITNKMNATVQR